MSGEVERWIGLGAGMTFGVLALSLVHGLPWWCAIAIMVAAGAGAGLMQGGWIVLFGVPSFIATLAGLLGWYGLQLYLIQTQNSDAILVPQRYIDDLTITYLPSRVAWPLAAGIVLGMIVLRARRLRRHRRAGLASESALENGLQLVVVAGVVIAATAVLASWKGIPTAAILFVGLVSVFAWISKHTPFG